MNLDHIANVLSEFRGVHPEFGLDEAQELARAGVPMLRLLKPDDFPLMPMLGEGRKRFEQAFEATPFIREKFNRAHLLAYKLDYLRAMLPEIAQVLPTRVLDLGPGFGEFMELCAAFGHEVAGIDSVSGIEMGGEYQALCKLVTHRQRLPVCRVDVWECVQGGSIPVSVLVRPPYGVVNCQGAFEQIFDACMDGSPLVNGAHGNELRRWQETSTTMERLRDFHSWVWDILEAGGMFAIYFNGYPNHDWLLKQCKERIWARSGWEIETEGAGGRFIKLRKVARHEGAADTGCAELGTGEVLPGVDQVPTGSGVSDVDDHPAGGSPGQPAGV